ncbi:MAG: hypothetical protein Q4B65_00750 [Candidatus Saccharibacteria bacterium]|nr:hypothetical protein [Candidatus Saccharibacteria bacterium]
MYNYNEVEKKERRKIISITVAIVALILVLLVAIIVVATRREVSDNIVSGDGNTEFVITEGEESSEAETEASAVETVSSEIVESTPVVLETETVIAQTGPEDVLPIAVVLGVLTAAGTAAYMKFIKA